MRAPDATEASATRRPPADGILTGRFPTLVRLRMRFRRKPKPVSTPIPLELIPWLCATALATLLPHVQYLPIWLSVFAGLALMARLGLWRQGTHALRRIWLIPLAALGTAGILWQYRTILGQEAGVALLVVLMALKLLEVQAQRDALVVVMLGYFLLLTHYFNADGISVGVWMLGAMTVTTATLIRIHAPGADSPRHTLMLAGRYVLLALPTMAILFLLFPRINGPLWGLPQDTRRATTGLSDSMSPGSISELTLSASLAFRASFDGRVPPREHLYWRGPVMSEFDGVTWKVARGLGRAPEGAIQSGGDSVRYTLTLEPHYQRWLLALDMPVELPPDTGLTRSLSLVTRPALRERKQFTLRSSLRYTTGPESAETLAPYLSLPADRNPRAVALGKSLAQGVGTTQRKAEVIAARMMQRFREESFVYTLRPPLLGEHPVDDFLFASRRGFCEHYASAFAVVMRAAGIPARVVGGYQGGELNPLEGFLTVRQSDAHAWTEIWTGERGWVRMDPTTAIAPARVEQGLEAAIPAGESLPALLRTDLDWLRALRHRWDTINNAWNLWVIGYDENRQRDLLSRFGLSADGKTLGALLAASAGVILLALAAWSLRPSQASDPALREWQRLQKRLSRWGLTPRLGEGPQDYGARAAGQFPSMGEVVKEAASRYIEIRYRSFKDERALASLKAAVRKIPRRVFPWSRLA